MPITPFPTLFTAPSLSTMIDPCSLDLTVANFFFQHPHTREQTPLSIYLGNLGPLRHQVNAPYPPGPLTSILPYVQAIGPDGVQRDEPIVSGMNPLDRPPYLGAGPIHTSLLVDLPPMAEIVRAVQEDMVQQPSVEGSTPQNGTPDPKVDVTSLAGRSLPLLFIRAYDGVGYHSGRAIALEHVFHDMEPIVPDDQSWVAAAQGIQALDSAMHSWTLRVI